MAQNDIGESYDTTGLLDEEQLNDLRIIFGLFDANGNGKISAKELGTILRTIGQDLTEAELRDLINDRDVDGNGTLDFIEFCNLMGAALKGDDIKEEIDTTFEDWSNKTTGTIGVKELSTAMKCIGEEADQAEIEEMIKEADSQYRADLADGQIQIEEFRSLLKSQ